MICHSMEAKKMKPGYRKKQIAAAAKKVFAAYGYHKANIEKICKKAGTSRGTIYRYFKNKEDIFTVILEESLDEMNRQMVDGYDFKASIMDTREEILEAYVDTVERIFTFLLSDRDFAKIALEISAGIGKRFTQIREEGERKNIAMIKAMMDQWKSNSLVRQDIDTELAAIRLRGALEKIARIFLFDNSHQLTREQIRTMIRKNAELDLFGMLVPPAATPTTP